MNLPKGILFDLGGTILAPTFDFRAAFSHVLSLGRNPREVSEHEIRKVAKEVGAEVERMSDQSGLEFKQIGFLRLVTAKFRKSVSAAGLPESLTLHSLRHTFASNLVQSGRSLYTHFWRLRNYLSRSAL